ncbi:hypothetical protein BDN71DRAFT_1433454 [Pleurotus eryngii]|uniref:Uncharacterized protein n=1 Tax=Pleurotus eryngii TaxID=5323 RepID=A0A9P5ZTP3_PLEER|nr:hypothetical protein BDN71DRAFT_1433454 [Pleurotus eryngii]
MPVLCGCRQYFANSGFRQHQRSSKSEICWCPPLPIVWDEEPILVLRATLVEGLGVTWTHRLCGSSWSCRETRGVKDVRAWLQLLAAPPTLLHALYFGVESYAGTEGTSKVQDYILEEHAVSTCSRNSKESGGNNYNCNTGSPVSRVYAWHESIARMHVNVPVGAPWMRP